MLDNHRVLNELCHKMDPTRLTTLACYAMCGPFNPVAHITDLVSWNLYLGWYVPGLFLNDLWMNFFHLVYPNRPLGFSEYGAEGMPNLHSAHPRRGDHTEEYQAKYHEYMLKCFDRHPWLWATHVWNMFDFAADARDQGGEPGMNHKGLVTFDRKTKKRTASTSTKHGGARKTLSISAPSGSPTAPRRRSRSRSTPTRTPSPCMRTAKNWQSRPASTSSGSACRCMARWS